MNPAQTLTKIDPDTKLKYVSSSKSILGTTYDFNLKCVHGDGDNKPSVESKLRGQTPGNPEDAVVDIAECSNAGSIARWSDSDPQDPDATEYSSSFSGTVSDSEHCSGLSEVEVESQFSKDGTLTSPFDAFNGMLHSRKKKLTDHWRNFIRPLMWRCKWTELRIQEIESQALKYSRALASYEEDSCSDFDEYNLVEEFGSKSLPYRHKWSNRKVVRRRKRKRVEEITDVASYMSHHSLFSYLDKENRGFDYETHYITNEVARSDKTRTEANNFEAISNGSSIISRHTDMALEQVLQKIGAVYSQVQKLRNQLDLIMSQNALKFSSSENLSLLLASFEEAQTSSVPSSTFSAGSGDLILVGSVKHPDYDLDNLVPPESVVSSSNEVVSIPDVIETTEGLLSAADVSLHQPMIGDTTEDVVDDVLIHNEARRGGENPVLKSSALGPIAKQQESNEGEQDESTDPSLQDANFQMGLEHKSGSGGRNK